MRPRLFASSCFGSSAFVLALALGALLGPANAAAQDDVGAAVEDICCGANCCLIDGVCASRGDVNPSNACQTCNPSTSQVLWTDTPGCGGTDSGPARTDAGTGGGGGGGCSATGTGSASQLGLLGLLGAIFLVRRRR